MNRQRRVRADVARYRPLLLNYILGWGIVGRLMALKGAVVGIAETLNLTLVAAAYYPSNSACSARCWRRTSPWSATPRRRDFDPARDGLHHESAARWRSRAARLLGPFGLANHRVLDGSVTDMERSSCGWCGRRAEPGRYPEADRVAVPARARGLVHEHAASGVHAGTHTARKTRSVSPVFAIW